MPLHHVVVNRKLPAPDGRRVDEIGRAFGRVGRDDPAVVGRALKRLMNDLPSSGHREIYLQPGRIWFYAHQQEIAVTPFDLWIEDLIVLAEKAEILALDSGSLRFAFTSSRSFSDLELLYKTRYRASLRGKNGFSAPR